MIIKFLYKIAQLGVAIPTTTREDDIENEFPRPYAGRPGRPATNSPDREYLTSLLLREFDNKSIQEPSDKNYANELINP